MLEQLAASGPAVSAADLATSAAVDNLDSVHRVLHKIGIDETNVWGEPYRVGKNDPYQEPIRVIARINREGGWMTVPLTGIEVEDVEAYRHGGDFDPGEFKFTLYARHLHGPRGRNKPMRVRLSRPYLELVLLAHYLMHCASSPRGMDKMTDPDLRQMAVVQAQTLLAADRSAALHLLAEPLFGGTQKQKLRQLNWLLEGQEAGLVVCRHCFHPINEIDPFLLEDGERESERHQRECDALPRISAHAACYEAWQAVRGEAETD
jgi:hypothetical protein